MYHCCILLVALQRVRSFFYNIRSISKVPYHSMAISFLYREGPAERLKRLKLPAVRKGNGFCLSNSSRLDSLCRQSYCCQAALIKSRFVLKQQITTSHFLMETVGKDSPFVQFPGPDNVMNPAFHRSMPVNTIAGVVPTLIAVIDKYEGKVPVTSIMQVFTLDVLGLAIFKKWRAEYKLVMGTLFDPVTNVFTGLDFLLRYVCPKRIRGAKAVNNLNKLFDQLVKEKRLEVQNGVHVNKPQDEKDLLTLMLEAKQRGEAMTTDMETGQVQQKLREEVDRVMGRESVDAAPTLEELSQMEYFLRLCSIFDVLVLRHTVEDMYLDDTFIPKDTRITVDVSAIQRDSKVWNRPDDFIPERFMEGGEAIGHEGMAWLPFGGGARQCIGMNFSLTEQKVALAMLGKLSERAQKDSIHYENIVYERPFYLVPQSLELTFTKLH
ncbi:cytochrome P450 [Rhizopus microsporus]|uniref:Cytochrome P450 n=1 Tax=Rhizopus microsporus TaxID=58291 RepID=A0A1X0RRB1_RHIZD|nr:cytochrome P450 [Rhizopus microsporus]